MKYSNQHHRSTTSLPIWGDLEGLYDNHLGSACLELDNNANIITYEEYHPFGTSSYRLGRNATEVQLKRYRYVGKERDEETGLYYYGARYYAAWICRFVSVDPLQFEYPELTPFQYASNAPISFIDLDGAEKATPINLHIPNYSNSVDHSGGLGPQILVNEQNINNAKYQIQQKQTQGQTVPNSNNQTVNQRSTILADQAASQATPLLITMEQLEKSLLTPQQLEIRQYIKENQWRNQATIYPTKSNYEKWLDVTIAPETANMVKYDPLFKATSIGGGLVTGGLAIKGLTVVAAGDAISLAPKVYSTTTNIYNTAATFYGTTAGQVTAGAAGGFILNLFEETPPDLNMPDPISNTVFQGVNLLMEYGKKITQPTFSTDSTQRR